MGLWTAVLNSYGGPSIRELSAMIKTAAKDFVKIPKQENSLLKEVYRTVQRQALLVRIGEAEKILPPVKQKKF